MNSAPTVANWETDYRHENVVPVQIYPERWRASPGDVEEEEREAGPTGGKGQRCSEEAGKSDLRESCWA